ncbi:MAG: hypothetical protein WDN10_04780 [bacterium]
MKTALIALIALVIIGGGYYWYSHATTAETSYPSDENGAPAQGKLNINVVCEGALAYMTFPDGESAQKFVAECKAGEHPEVIERYKAEMHLGEGAAI